MLIILSSVCTEKSCNNCVLNRLMANDSGGREGSAGALDKTDLHLHLWNILPCIRLYFFFFFFLTNSNVPLSLYSLPLGSLELACPPPCTPSPWCCDTFLPHLPPSLALPSQSPGFYFTVCQGFVVLLLQDFPMFWGVFLFVSSTCVAFSPSV